MVVGLPGNKSPYSNRLTLVFQSLRMMYDYKLNLVVRTPRACPWESSDFLNPTSLPWVVMSCVTRGVGLAPLNAVVFGLLGDVVEFGQWKTHIRQESLIFVGGSLGAKIGSGIATAIITGLLSAAGYISSSANGITQPDSAIRMILNVYKFGPMVVWIIVIVVLSLYQLDKKYSSIVNELARREANGEL